MIRDRPFSFSSAPRPSTLSIPTRTRTFAPTTHEASLSIAMATLHALVIPHPLQGHITPLLQLSHKLLSSYSVAITFVVTEHLLPRMNSQALLPIKLVGVPDNLAQEHPRQSTFLDSYEANVGMEASVHSYMQDCAAQNRLPSCIIADGFVTWAHDLALKYGIPSVAFVTTNVAAMSVMSSITKLIDCGILPLMPVGGSSKFGGDLITCIPGVPPLHPSELPVSMTMPSITHYRMQFVKVQFAEASKAVAVLVNSFTEIETSILEGLEFKVPTLCIGPTLILNGESAALQPMGGSLWPEQEDCLSWLDNQASQSVLYVSFGSMANLDKLQLVKLAHGLEASEQPFLWVIRPGSSEGFLSDNLPTGFLERTKNRGYIVSWCPQLLVLSHRATGGFLTHCGWNSVLENICLGGVPMICWPDAAEQALNARMIIDVWKVGLRVHKEDDGIVKREEVNRVVRAVMQAGEAKHLKVRAGEMKDAANRAVEEGGSSQRNIEKVLEIVASKRRMMLS